MAKAKRAKSTGGFAAPKAVVWVVVAALVLVAGYALLKPAGPKGSSAGGVVNVDTAKIQQLQAQGVRVVDVRSPGEFEGGHIPGAENVPIDTFESASASWDKTQPVILYCQSGSRSQMAIDILQRGGYKGTIYHLANGIVEWNGPTEQGTAAAPPALKPTATPVMYEFFTGW
jgi:rhodanese-related sulfurtransferase